MFLFNTVDSFITREELKYVKNREKQPSQMLKSCFYFSDSFELHVPVYEIITKFWCLPFYISAIWYKTAESQN